MYAVIRAGGKQYRVAPGDVVKIEKLSAGHGEKVEFSDVLAVSAEAGQIGSGQGALVTGQIVESGRADKILVFHFKRKKQYKKIYGHRQPFTAVRITEIAFEGHKFSAPELETPKKKAKPARAEATEPEAAGEAKETKAAETTGATKKARHKAKKAPAKAKGKKK